MTHEIVVLIRAVLTAVYHTLWPKNDEISSEVAEDRLTRFMKWMEPCPKYTTYSSPLILGDCFTRSLQKNVLIQTSLKVLCDSCGSCDWNQVQSQRHYGANIC